MDKFNILKIENYLYDVLLRVIVGTLNVYITHGNAPLFKVSSSLGHNLT